MLIALASLILIGVGADTGSDLAYMKELAQQVVDSAKVVPGESIPGVGPNNLGATIRVPGGTKTFYPAFWIRDAAMMLGAHLVPADELAGWIRVVAKTQTGPGGLSFPHGLTIPPYSIPDHITLRGEACWFPGAYADQGVGNYGYLPPADDAFYFIQMVWEQFRITGSAALLKSSVDTGWGSHPLIDVCARAFESVATDPESGLVQCSDEHGQGRVDWGFCDSIHKSGSCLMPSLLRWQAAGRLAAMCQKLGDSARAHSFRLTADGIARSLIPTFFREIDDQEGFLLSATKVGRKDDVWASAFAVWLRVLPRKQADSVARHLRQLVAPGGVVEEGQVREVPPAGEFGGNWESASSGQESYQNGGYWATPTGWLVTALRTVDRPAGDRLLAEYVQFVKSHRAAGAPFEWVNPHTGTQSNGNYASSAGLVYAALVNPGG